MNELQNKIAIVTGGGSGIGSVISLELAKLGADIAIVDKQKSEKTNDMISNIEQFGRKIKFYESDVSNYSEVHNTVKKILEDFSHIDILVNNAGINRDHVVWKMTEEEWDAVISVNLKGCFNFINAVSPIFREQKSGRIVNISSINGLRGKFGLVNYSASKAGIIGITKTVAVELAKYNVNVNAVAPGLIETEMTKKMTKEAWEESIKEIPLGRVGKPEDVANVVAFLCTEKAKHITGEIIKVDGGQYI
jgi:3-oxoacyl-[acyl-carrier protein] reductase